MASEFELLAYFMENKGIALSREKILNNVWVRNILAVGIGIHHIYRNIIYAADIIQFFLEFLSAVSPAAGSIADSLIAARWGRRAS